jgi:hypothetical protein
VYTIAFPDGTPVCSRTVYMTRRAAESSASRRLNDPPRRAPATPHIPRQTWREAGYRVIPCDGPSLSGPAAPAPSHHCLGGGLICYMPPRPLGRPVWRTP